MTIAKIIAEIARITGLSVSNADELARMESAITNAGQAAAEWRDWWWLKGSGTFDTTDSTAAYDLRTELDDTSLWAVKRVYWDDEHILSPIPYERYRDLYVLNDTGSTATMYAVTADPPMLYLYPTPSSATALYVDYVKQHAEIEDDSDDALLIVPSRFHYRVYVNGAVFLLNNGIGDPAALSDSPGFVAAMDRMAVMDPESHAEDHVEDMHPDAVGGHWPHNKRVLSDGYSTIFLDNPSL
jgi:hypothetical protein